MNASFKHNASDARIPHDWNAIARYSGTHAGQAAN
jgi:hypothetical protein